MADAALAGEQTDTLPIWCGGLLHGLAERLAAEGERCLLWLPVFLGAGIGIHFVPKVEPPLWPGFAAAVAGAGAAWGAHRHPG